MFGKEKVTVMKSGTSAHFKDDGTVDIEFIRTELRQVQERRKKGEKVILVESGAVKMGRKYYAESSSSKDKSKEHLRLRISHIGKRFFKNKNSKTSMNQERVKKKMNAGMGQAQLMALYSKVAEEMGMKVAQILVNSERGIDRRVQVIEEMLRNGIIPIFNADDTDEVKDGVDNNDTLAKLIAIKYKAKTLVLITDVKAVYRIVNGTKQFVHKILFKDIEHFRQYITKETSNGGTGGMTTKFDAAKDVGECGCDTYIVSKDDLYRLSHLLDGKAVDFGTKFCRKENFRDLIRTPLELVQTRLTKQKESGVNVYEKG